LIDGFVGKLRPRISKSSRKNGNLKGGVVMEIKTCPNCGHPLYDTAKAEQKEKEIWRPLDHVISKSEYGSVFTHTSEHKMQLNYLDCKVDTYGY